MSEKVFLIGAETLANEENFQMSMEELASLAITANGTVVYTLTQKRQYVDHKTVIGKGKLQEAAQLADAHEAQLVIFNQELSPSQSQSISDVIGLPVIDRVQLILDIFAKRAKSKEGKLQVELAQLNYLLPRLVGQGKSLSRLGGGIGTRGPGETKLETDRRHIRRRITAIKRELKVVSEHRKRSRQRRQAQNIYQIGLIGYTNAGKSSLLNFLTDASAYAKDQLFATLDPLTRKWQLDTGMEVTVTDTVGFIQELPTQLIEAFQSTLEESRSMDMLIHVVDASSKNHTNHEETVMELLDELDMNHIPMLTVYNKADLIDKADFTPTLYPSCIISTRESKDKVQLTKSIEQTMKQTMKPYEITLDSDEGKLLQRLQQETIIEKNEFQPESEQYLIKGFAKSESYWLKRMEQIDELDR